MTRATSIDGLPAKLEATNVNQPAATGSGRARQSSAGGGFALPRLAYTMKETAEMLGLSYITVHRLIKRGLLRSSKALRHKLIPATEIEKFLKSTLN